MSQLLQNPGNRLFLTENHDELCNKLREHNLYNKMLIHIDSHHDMGKTGTKMTIGNFITYAIHHHYVNRVVWVVPDHYFTNLSYFQKLVFQIDALTKHRYKMVLGKRFVFDYECIYVEVCPIDELTIEEWYGGIVDIDIDYFIYNTPCFICDSKAPFIWMQPSMLINKIQRLLHAACCINLTLSVQGYFTPFRFSFLQQELYSRILYLQEPSNGSEVGLYDKLHNNQHNHLAQYCTQNDTHISSYMRGYAALALSLYYWKKRDWVKSQYYADQYIVLLANVSWSFEYYYQKRKYRIARDEIERLLCHCAHDVLLCQTIAVYFIRSKLYDQAQTILDRLVVHEKGNAEIFSCVSELYYQKKQYHIARKYAHLAIRSVCNRNVTVRLVNPNHMYTSDYHLDNQYFYNFYRLAMIDYKISKTKNISAINIYNHTVKNDPKALLFQLYCEKSHKTLRMFINCIFYHIKHKLINISNTCRCVCSATILWIAKSR